MSDTYSKTRLPIQKLPLSKKGDDWKQANVDYYIAKEGGGFKDGLARTERKKILYDLWNSKYNLNDLKYVTNPYKVDDAFPAQPQNFNIIRPKIELLIGEESKRPFQVRVIKTGQEGYSQVQEAYKNMLFEYIMSQTEQPEGEEGEEQQTPKQIQDYIKHSYADIAEKKAHYALKYLEEKLNLSNEFLKGWRDALIAGEEVYYIGIINGEPVVERINPLTLTYDNAPDLEFIEDGEWTVRHMLMSPSAIYDRFFDIMEESDLDKILDLTNQQGASSTGSTVNYNTVVFRSDPSSNSSSGIADSDNYIDVWHTVWKSFKRIGFLTYIDEEGESEETIVDETYSLTKEEKARGSKLEWEWVVEVWEGYRVGNDIYIGIQPIQNQMISIDNPNSNKLPYTGAIYNNSNTDGVSLVELMKPLQYMYIVIWYRLELALSRDKGKIINMDITQIPKSMGVDVNKWMHMIGALGVNLFNPYEEGWDIPGREGGKPAQFNQMSAQDLGMANTIIQYIELMNKIEEMVGELSGVSRQRQGAINTHELVGNVERSVIQSSHITEPYFWIHNQVKKNVITLLLNTAKIAWSNRPDSVKLNYILDDTTRICLDMSDDFLYSDYAIFASDSSEEARKLEQLQSLYQAALQNGATLVDIASIMTMDNITEIKKKLEEIEDKRMEQQQQMQQQQAEQEQQMLEMELQARAEDNRIKEEDSIRRSETAIEVAMINAEARVQSATTYDDEGMHDESEEEILRQKLEIDRERMAKEFEIKRAQIEETVRKNRKNEELKEKEIAIKRSAQSNAKKSK